VHTRNEETIEPPLLKRGKQGRRAHPASTGERLWHSTGSGVVEASRPQDDDDFRVCTSPRGGECSHPGERDVNTFKVGRYADPHKRPW